MFTEKELAAIRRMVDVVEREWEARTTEAEQTRARYRDLESECSDLSRACTSLKRLVGKPDC